MTRKLKLLLSLIMLVSAISCSSDEAPERDLRAMYEQISIGMSYAEVVKAIGEPDSESLSEDENTVWHMNYQNGDYDILSVTFSEDSVTIVNIMQALPPGSIL